MNMEYYMAQEEKVAVRIFNHLILKCRVYPLDPVSSQVSLNVEEEERRRGQSNVSTQPPLLALKMEKRA